MFKATIEETGNKYRRETGVTCYLKISYMGDFPCSGKSTCGMSGNHFDTPTDLAWVREAANKPEIWHRKSDSATLNLQGGKLSIADYKFAMEKFAEFAELPVKNRAQAEIKESAEQARKLLMSVRPESR
jgi:hypothetical protein